MIALPNQTLIFLIQMTVLYFFSRTTIQEIFYFFATFTSNKKIIFSLTSFLFFPGTVLHELAHFIMAIALMLRVREVVVFPEWEGNSIKLGRVLYEKKDFLRGIMVGIAPIIAGVFFFWLISYWAIRADGNLLLTSFLVYAMFIVSTTMFSSKQDLIDIIFIIPLLIVIGAVLYILKIPVLDVVFQFLPIVDDNLHVINQFLLYSLIIHVVLIGGFKSYRKLIQRRK